MVFQISKDHITRRWVGTTDSESPDKLAIKAGRRNCNPCDLCFDRNRLKKLSTKQRIPQGDVRMWYRPCIKVY